MYVTLPNEILQQNNTSARSERSAKMRARSVARQSHLYRECDKATSVYEVISGVLRLTRVMEDGRRQVIAFGYPGDIVGFPSDGHYHTDCDCLTDAKVVAHKRAELETSAGDARLHSRLLQAALREISAMQDHFLMLGRKSASERVASFLTTLSKRVGTPIGQYTQFTLPMGRSDIADFLGLTTETVSRAITRLRKSKIIAVDHIHTIIVLKPDALSALADSNYQSSP